MKKKGSVWFGILMIVLGAIFLLDSTGTIDIGDLIHIYWPLLLVAWGISMLFRRDAHRKGAGWSAAAHMSTGSGPAEGSIASESLQSSNVLGDVNVRVTSTNFKGGTVTTVFGDVNVDLREAAVADGEYKLAVSGVFGDACVIVPPGAALAITVHTLFGDAVVLDQKRGGVSASITFTSPGFAEATKRLKIDVSQVFGDIEVRH